MEKKKLWEVNKVLIWRFLFQMIWSNCEFGNQLTWNFNYYQDWTEFIRCTDQQMINILPSINVLWYHDCKRESLCCLLTWQKALLVLESGYRRLGPAEIIDLFHFTCCRFQKAIIWTDETQQLHSCLFFSIERTHRGDRWAAKRAASTHLSRCSLMRLQYFDGSPPKLPPKME